MEREKLVGMGWGLLISEVQKCKTKEDAARFLERYVLDLNEHWDLIKT